MKTMTKKEIKELANDIFETDNGYGTVPIKEINKTLFDLGIVNKNGEFLTNLTGAKEKLANELMELIG